LLEERFFLVGVPRVRVPDAPRVVRPDELDRPLLDVLLLREPGGEDVRVAMTPNVGHRHSSHTDHTAVSALDRTSHPPQEGIAGKFSRGLLDPEEGRP
jgi:hypothetical protein